ncbi:unnamed protein product [Arabis nemorensis]|uniref:Small ribosomal subunit protein eS4 N-terminal domain-containing protein n=1 Tax=Arabis nemorensis TaxID=586526 RepID=A0A565AUL5_9BRAS|nr:unnamed protein product [Arabis nemorensis]
MLEGVCFSRRRDQNAFRASRANMTRGLKKHMKRLNAPEHWMLDKLGGAFDLKPSSGPHKLRECLSLVFIILNRLKYALTYGEVISNLMQRHIQVEGKFTQVMDVVSIPKNE